jgi:hypothetical protein
VKPGRYCDGKNLYLIVGKGPNSKSWEVQWWVAGKPRYMGIGSYKAVGLARARELAAQALADIAEGKDPRRQRDIRRGASKTFAEVAKEAIAHFAAGWRNKRTPATWEHFLFVHAVALRDIPIGKIERDAVLGVLQPM